MARWIASIESEDVLFGSAQQSLSATSREQLNMISAKLAQLYGHFIIEVTGHTDDSGDADENLRLSHMRALSVVEYLSQKTCTIIAFWYSLRGISTYRFQCDRARTYANRKSEIRVVADGDAKD
ncbi:MAG: OmpA family protein [Bdellovibrionota bacterium]